MYARVQYNQGMWRKAKTPIPRKYNTVLMVDLVGTIKHAMMWRKCGFNDHKNQVSLYHITINQLLGHKTESSKSVRTSAGTFKFISYCPSLDVFSGPRRACCLMKFVTMPGWTADIVNRHPQVTRAKGWKKRSRTGLSCINIHDFHKESTPWKREEAIFEIRNKDCKIRLETYKTAYVISVQVNKVKYKFCYGSNKMKIWLVSKEIKFLKVTKLSKHGLLMCNGV